MFADQACIPVCLFVFGSCILIHKFCLKIGLVLKIWKITDVIEKGEARETDNQDEIIYLLKKIENMMEEVNPDEHEEIPEHVAFKNRDWAWITQTRIKDAQLNADLRTDRVMAESFKDLFLTYNKPWLKANIQEVFTPRTIFVKRKMLIEQFKQILGPCSPDISLKDEISQESTSTVSSQKEHSDLSDSDVSGI